MNILIVEDDPWLSELLRQIISHLAPTAQLHCFEQAVAAQNQLKRGPVDLLISDLRLPDGSGLEVIAAARRTSPQSARILITAHIDRQTVLEARQAGITDFIAKPFKIDDLSARLARVLSRDGNPDSSAPASLVGDLPGFLRERLEQPLQLAWSSPQVQQQAAAMQPGKDALNFIQQQPLLALVLISRANRQELDRGDAPCTSIREAYQDLGADSCCQLAQQLSRSRIALTAPELQQAAADLSQKQATLRAALQKLATPQALAPGPLNAAITFCYLGEMAVLCALQQFLNYGQTVPAEQVAQSLDEFAASFGNRIKAQLKLPFLLRELTGSLFQLPQTSQRKDRIIMRIAALECGFAGQPGEMNQLRRWIGLPVVSTNASANTNTDAVTDVSTSEPPASD